MRKICVLSLFFIFTLCYSQSGQSISYIEIRQQVDNLSITLKNKKIIEDMYIAVNEGGERWILIKDSGYDGLKTDENIACKDLIQNLLSMLHSSINYNLDKPISFSDFLKIMNNKGILGLKFETKNYLHAYNWQSF